MGKCSLYCQEKSDPNFVKCECIYVLLSIWQNMRDRVVGLNHFLMLLFSKFLKVNTHFYIDV